MSTETALTPYQDATTKIAEITRALAPTVEFQATPEEFLDVIARGFVDNATDARTRTGAWAFESTSEQIENALFYGTVASDILDGTVERPSTGNVRQYALNVLHATTS